MIVKLCHHIRCLYTMIVTLCIYFRVKCIVTGSRCVLPTIRLYTMHTMRIDVCLFLASVVSYACHRCPPFAATIVIITAAHVLRGVGCTVYWFAYGLIL